MYSPRRSMWFPGAKANPAKVSLATLVFAYHVVAASILFNCHLALGALLKIKDNMV